MYGLRIYKAVTCHDNEEWYKISKEIDLSAQNWHEEYNNFWSDLSKISKIFTLMDSFWPKYIMFEFRKYRRVIFDVIQDWCKVWLKTYLCFQKWHEEFDKFSPEHLKVSKLGLPWHPFVQMWQCMSLKFTGELRVMTVKNDAKFEEGSTCQFKINY